MTASVKPGHGGWSTTQKVVLIVMGGVLVAIAAALVLVIRSVGMGSSAELWATVALGPTPTPTPPLLVPDARPTPDNLYWPPHPVPLATPNAPGGLLWWDARFTYRRPIVLDEVAANAPAGVWAQVLFDGEQAQRDGKMRADGADLRVLVWDGVNWWEIPRRAQPRRSRRGWKVIFHMQGPALARVGRYYLYYGYPAARTPPVADGAPDSSRMLLEIGAEEGVEWGPEVTWTTHSTATQTLVSPDGRVVISCPPGGPAEEVRVRLRTVPIGERNILGVLPDFELHADPPPGPPGHSGIAHWRPPLVVTINWAGLPVDVGELEGWTYFAYDEDSGTWYGVPVEFDRERGLIRLVTDQL